MKKTIFKYFLILLMVFGISIPVSYGANQSLNQKLKQTNNKRDYMHQKKQQADLKLRKEKNKLSTNQQKLESTHAALQTNTVKYNNLVSSLGSMEVRLNVAISEFRQKDAEFKKRICTVYKHQRTGMFQMILTSKDVNSLLDILYFEKLVIQSDYKKMQELKSRADQIARLKSDIENQKRRIEISIKEINNQRLSIQNSIRENKNMIERLQKDKAYYEKTERELARQSANIQSMIASRTKSNAKSGTSPVIAPTGKFMRPIGGPITSPFGWRTHPIFKSRIFHSGIDIGGPNRGAIHAANDGKVIYSGWYGGYGKVVIIDHGVINGNPITTLYGHMSQINVSNGQYVKKGQTVGLEGSTGYSTGPHCHFEVRVNGKPTNPLNYI